MNELDKKEIIKKLKNISYEDAILDLNKLTKYDINKITSNTRIGNKFIDYFTFPNRLDVISKKQITYWDFVSSIDNQKNKKYLKSLFDYQNDKGIEYYKGLYSIFKFHCGSIGLFKPIRAKKIIDIYKPKNILDFTMGWGCRLTASCICNIDSYIGIDNNLNLLVPLTNMTKLLKENGSTTKVTLMFKDCQDVDYSKLKYDCVLTSPPYYNYEIYDYCEKKSINEWNAWYKDIFSKTYNNLLVGGFFIINILNDIYDNVLFPMFGEAHIIIPINNKSRKSNKKSSNENIFIWIKKTPFSI